MSKVTICSIFPMKQVESREMFCPKSEYILEKPEPGSYSTLVIEDQTQGRYVGNDLDMPINIKATAIANDMIRSFRDGFGFQNITGRPGIWITENKNGKPSAEEIKKATKDQMLFANSVIEQATRFWQRKRYENINAIHYVMADWRGVDGLDWQEGTERSGLEKCPFCLKGIPRDTIKCRYCGEIVDHTAYEAMRVKIGAPPASDTEADPEPEELEVEAEEKASAGREKRVAA